MTKSHHFLMTCSLLFPLAMVGCEDPGAVTTNEGGAKSTLGKAKESAERTLDKMEKRQEDLSKQADDIFGDGS